MQEIKKTAERFRQGNYGKMFMICWGYMLAVFFSMYSNGLVNQWDGIWEYHYYMAGRWSVSLGRWLWPFLDRMKMGLGTEPLATMSGCALFALGVTIAVFFLCDQKRAPRMALLYAFLFLGSASVCISLSYRFMSATYGFAFVFSILAVFILAEIRKAVPAVICSGFLIAAQMGLYQAYLGCTGLMLLVWLMRQLAKRETSFKDMMRLIGKATAAVIFGGILYLAGLKLCLRFSHTALASYKGIENYSVANTLCNLKDSVGNAYRVFGAFFFSESYRTNLFMKQPPIYIILIVVIAVAVLFRLFFYLRDLFSQSGKKGILGIIFFLLSPAAVNAVLMIATAADTSLQMTVPMALYLPMILCLFDQAGDEKRGQPQRIRKIADVVILGLLLIFLYGTVLQTQVDQEAMRVGMLSVTNMADGMVEDLKTEGYLNCGKPVCVVGVPSGNELYYFPKACEGANHYAVFGTWGAWSDRDSWQGVFHHLLGLNIEFASKEQSGRIKGRAELKSMPCFPEVGYIEEIDGVIVLKVSDSY